MARKNFVVGEKVIADNIPSTTETTITTNSATTIASFNKDTADNVEFTVKVVQGNRRLSTKALTLHNGTTVDLAQYGEISIPSQETISGTGATTWTTRTSNFGNARIFDVDFGNGAWVAVGDYGDIRTSTDATAWTTRTSNFSGGSPYILSVAFGNNLWVAVGGSNTGAQLRTSTDAVTWVTRNPSIAGSTDWLGAVAFGNGVFLIGSEGTGQR